MAYIDPDFHQAIQICLEVDHDCDLYIHINHFIELRLDQLEFDFDVELDLNLNLDLDNDLGLCFS